MKKQFAAYDGGHVLHVSKRNFTLDVYDRNLKVVATYRIGYGKNPDRKTKMWEGDNRTPEGVFRIDEILSMDADPDSPSYRGLKALNEHYFKASDGYTMYGKPGVDLGDNAFGPRFFKIDYPRPEDVRRYESLLKKGKIPEYKGKTAGIGANAAIHGNNDENGIGTLSSSGCIRLFNNDIVELDQYVRIGTPVIITPN